MQRIRAGVSDGFHLCIVRHTMVHARSKNDTAWRAYRAAIEAVRESCPDKPELRQRHGAVREGAVREVAEIDWLSHIPNVTTISHKIRGASITDSSKTHQRHIPSRRMTPGRLQAA